MAQTADIVSDEIENVQIDDTDSAYGEPDSQSELSSLRSSVYEYQYSNGRRYHAYHAGSYWGPNDEHAQDHLDLSHHLCKVLLGGRLHLAPIGDQIGRVLDVGTGTGIWAIEFADEHSAANVLGTDLSPIQPDWVPPNLSFEVSDCCEPWAFRTPFDFIHIRFLYGSVADWDAFYAEAYKNLKPGGWVEQLEQSVVPKSFDGTTDGTIFEEWGTTSLKAGDAFGKTLRIADESADCMRKAGFENVSQKSFAVPIGSWAKDPVLKHVGKLNRLQWEEGIEGWSVYLLTRFLGWSMEEVQIYLMRMREGLKNRNIHAYQEFTVAYGQKPLS